MEDHEGHIWFATNNGLSRWNPVSNKWNHYYQNKSEQAKVFLTLCEDSQGRIGRAVILPASTCWIEKPDKHFNTILLKLILPAFQEILSLTVLWMKKEMCGLAATKIYPAIG